MKCQVGYDDPRLCAILESSISSRIMKSIGLALCYTVVPNQHVIPHTFLTSNIVRVSTDKDFQHNLHSIICGPNGMSQMLRHVMTRPADILWGTHTQLLCETHRFALIMHGRCYVTVDHCVLLGLCYIQLFNVNITAGVSLFVHLSECLSMAMAGLGIICQVFVTLSEIATKLNTQRTKKN